MACRVAGIRFVRDDAILPGVLVPDRVKEHKAQRVLIAIAAWLGYPDVGSYNYATIFEANEVRRRLRAAQ